MVQYSHQGPSIPPPPPSPPNPAPRMNPGMMHPGMERVYEDFNGIRIVESGMGNRNNGHNVYPEQQPKARPVVVTRGSSSNSSKGPVLYEEYIFTKEQVRPGQKEAWSRSRKTAIPRDQNDLQDRVNQQLKKEGPSRKQLNAPEMAGNKQVQIKQLLENRMRRDDPRFEYLLASIKLDQRRTKKSVETSTMDVIVKRQLRPDIPFDPAMPLTAPPPIVSNELVDLTAQHGLPGPFQGGPPQIHMNQGAFHNPGQMNAQWGNAGRPGPQIIDDRFQPPPQQGGHPTGGQHHHVPPPPPPGPPFFPQDQGGKHGFEDKGNKPKDKKGKSPKIIPMDSRKSRKKHQEDFSDVTSFSDNIDELFDTDDFGRVGFDDKVKRPKDRKKSLDMDDFEFVDFTDKGKKSKDKKRSPKIIPMDAPKPKKKQQEFSDSESISDINDSWSHNSDDSFPTTISKDSEYGGHGGHSYKKSKDFFKEDKKGKDFFKEEKRAKEYYKEAKPHKSSNSDRHSPQPVYREHKRKVPEPRRRDPSPVSSRRSGGQRYAEDDILIEPASSRQRHRDPPHYVGGGYGGRERPTHHHASSYDGDVYPNDHLRGLGRSHTIYRRKIDNSAYPSNHYDSDIEREEEEIRIQNRIREEAKVQHQIREDARVQQQVREVLAKQEEDARIRRRVQDALARKQEEEERRVQEQVQESLRRERMAREPVYDPWPPRRAPRTYYDDGY